MWSMKTELQVVESIMTGIYHLATAAEIEIGTSLCGARIMPSRHTMEDWYKWLDRKAVSMFCLTCDATRQDGVGRCW